MKNLSFRKINVFLFFTSIVAYLSVFISPAIFWPIGLINYLIPVLLIALLGLLVFSLISKRRRKYFWMPLATLLLGFYFVDISFNIPNFSEPNKTDFTVLSFNTRYFRERKDYSRFKSETIQWAAQEGSDIKCFQEFSFNSDKLDTDILRQMENEGYRAHIYSEDTGANNRGLAIFSKFPIVNKGLIILNKGTHNNCLYADVLIESDTIRVYNFHLKSMNLRLGEFTKIDRFSDKSRNTVTKLGSASSKRAVELDQIIHSIGECPYPYILAGDFNEIIYGNNYYKIREVAANTFEEAGSGFGFTFNSILFFIRIDHQFFSEGIESTNFSVLKEVKSSDHYPVKGWYNISP